MSSNPLIRYLDAKNNNQPIAMPFDEIKAEHFVPAMEWAVDVARGRVKTLKAAPDEFDAVVVGIEGLSKEAEFLNSLVYSYLTTQNSPAITSAKEALEEMGNALDNEISFDKDIFDKLHGVYQKRDTMGLDDVQKRLLDKTYKGFVRSGALLNDDDQKRFAAINDRLSALATQWTNNYLGASNDMGVYFADKTDLPGVPDEVLDVMEKRAKERGHESGYLVTDEGSIYGRFMRLCENRDAREKVWRAGSHLAYKDKFDNNDIMIEMAGLRHERAKLLGYENTIAYQLEDRMAKNKQEILRMADDIGRFSKTRAQAEKDALSHYAMKAGQNEGIKPWDYSFYADKFKKEIFQFDQDELKEYLSLDACIQMIFDHEEKLLNVDFSDVTDEYSVPADGTRVLEAKDKKTGDVLGIVYLDLMERKGKMQGASAAPLERRLVRGGEGEPATLYIRGSVQPPQGDKPSLLSFDNLIMLAHEMGHAMHSLVATSPYDSLSGTAVAADFVEFPSQVNERWFNDYDIISRYAKHYKTGETVPEDLFQNMKDSANFGAGLGKLGYLRKMIFDLNIHSGEPLPSQDIRECEQIWGKGYESFDFEGQCFSPTFDHLFDMPQCQYVAGYYVYLWADILAADGFDYFKQSGLYDTEKAEKLKALFAAGGTVDPAELYERFRGGKADPMALIRELDLDKTSILPDQHAPAPSTASSKPGRANP